MAAIFADWQCCSDGGAELLDPVQGQYKEFFLVVGCTFSGQPASRCVYIWVDKDFAMYRGWIQGFPKKLGAVHMTRTYPVGKATPRLEPGARFGATCTAGSREIARAVVTLRGVSTHGPTVNAPPMHNTRHFPAYDGLVPDVFELVRAGGQDREVTDIWEGDAELTLGEPYHRAAAGDRAAHDRQGLPLHVRLHRARRKGADAARQGGAPMTRARIWHDGRLVDAALDGDALATQWRRPRRRRPAPSTGRRSWPRQIIATHLTYRSRCDEYRMAAPPQYPSYFLKPLGSVSHHGARVARPARLPVPELRGRAGRGDRAHVLERRRSNARWSSCSGYTVADDFGVHDFRHADRGSMFRVKGQDGFCPLGPVLVDAADIDPADLWLRTYVNGALVQEAHTGTDLIFSVAYQIADISRLVTLEAGDVLLTGTPANSRPGAARRRRGGGDQRASAGSRTRSSSSSGICSRSAIQPRITEQTLHVALAIPEIEARTRVSQAATATAEEATMTAARLVGGLHHAVLRVASLDEAVGRWTTLLGLHGEAVDRETVVMRCTYEDYALVLKESAEPAGSTPCATSWLRA